VPFGAGERLAGALASITSPVITTTGTRVPGLRFGDPRAHALPAALCVFKLLPHGHHGTPSGAM
jgi:hypothetical protein